MGARAEQAARVNARASSRGRADQLTAVPEWRALPARFFDLDAAGATAPNSQKPPSSVRPGRVAHRMPLPEGVNPGEAAPPPVPPVEDELLDDDELWAGSSSSGRKREFAQRSQRTAKRRTCALRFFAIFARTFLPTGAEELVANATARRVPSPRTNKAARGRSLVSVAHDLVLAEDNILSLARGLVLAENKQGSEGRSLVSAAHDLGLSAGELGQVPPRSSLSAGELGQVPARSRLFSVGLVKLRGAPAHRGAHPDLWRGGPFNRAGRSARAWLGAIWERLSAATDRARASK
jgi:hypothetical protein